VNTLSKMFLCVRMCGLVGGVCAWVVFGGWDAAGVPPTDAPPAPIRLAVLATTGVAETAALADLRAEDHA
jgi:hypothetical protein